MSELVPLPAAEVVSGERPPLVDVWTDADRFLSPSTVDRIGRSAAENTKTAYRRQWLLFERWCAERGRASLPATPETLADYINHLVDVGYSIATCKQAMAVVRSRHSALGFPNTPDMRGAKAVLRTAARDLAEAGDNVERKSLPVIVDALRRMVETCYSGDPKTRVMDTRDRVLLLLGIAIFARRSELADLRWSDLTYTQQGLLVRIRKSKTDQDAKGVDVPVLRGKFEWTNPLRAVEDWRKVCVERGINSGYLLRSVNHGGGIGDRIHPSSINAVVRKRAELAGIEDADKYTAHSLRAGAATIAYMNGAPVQEICRMGRWSSKSSVVLGYIRSVDQWKHHPFEGVF